MGVMEYSLCWICEGWDCVGHVDFMLFVSLLLALGIGNAKWSLWVKEYNTRTMQIRDRGIPTMI